MKDVLIRFKSAFDLSYIKDKKFSIHEAYEASV